MSDELSKQIQDDINRILSDQSPTREEITGETQETAEQRVEVVHVYDLPAAGEETDAQDQQQDESQLAAPAQHPYRQRVLLTLLGGLCLLLVLVVLAFVLSPWFTSATVTIIPVTQQISTTSTVTVVTGQTPTGAQQITGSMLSPVSMSQAKTVPTTGKGHQDAQAASGSITFYNSATYVQTVTAGTLLVGADGTQVVTDQDVTIPAATMPTEGQATVSAHALQTGPAGNIQASDIYGACCRANVFAANGPFTGGQAARDFQAVSQADMKNAVSSLKSSLDQSIQAALKTQVASDQTLITPLSCQESVTPDHQVGGEATQLHVSLTETCTGATYNTENLQRLVLQQINWQARTLGKGYMLTGAIQNSILAATPQAHGAVTLQVRSTASYAYQFSQQQQQNIKAMIAGKSKAQATSMLLQVTGVQSVSLSLSYGDQLPNDPNHIQLAFFGYAAVE
jgi:hypothetical protein